MVPQSCGADWPQMRSSSPGHPQFFWGVARPGHPPCSRQLSGNCPAFGPIVSSDIAMQPNEFIPALVLLAAAFCGWKLLRFVRLRSTVIKVAGSVSSIGILLITGCLLLLYGCGMVLEYRSSPTFSPDGKYRAQIKELDFGAMDTLHLRVEVRSRWHLFPETVFSSGGTPTIAGASDGRILLNPSKTFSPYQTAAL